MAVSHKKVIFFLYSKTLFFINVLFLKLILNLFIRILKKSSVSQNSLIRTNKFNYTRAI